MSRNLDFNHPLLLTSFRYEVLLPRNKLRQARWDRIAISNKHPWLDHPLLGTNFREEFANCMNPVSISEAKRKEQEKDGTQKKSIGGCNPDDTCDEKIRLGINNPLQRTNARYDFMLTRLPGPGCKMPGEIRILPNNTIHETPYRYETKASQMLPLRVEPTVDGFEANINNPIFRTSFRYEHARPRITVDPCKRPVLDFHANYNNPLFGTNFRYEYAKPRPLTERAAAIAKEQFTLAHCK